MRRAQCYTLLSLRGGRLSMLLSKRLALSPTSAEVWRRAFDVWRGPSSSFERLGKLVERMREGADLQVPDAPPTKAPPPTVRRGKPPIHNWPAIRQFDDTYCREYLKEHERVPSWKERHANLEDELGPSRMPHFKTLQRRLRSRGRSI
jgi:hypothetical protein